MVDFKVKSLDKAPWLGEVPAHWEHRKVSHLGVLGRGRVISNLELIPDGKYPVYSSQTHRNGEMGRINTYDFNGDYVTWTTDGANAGTVFSRKGKFNCTNVCGTIKPKKTISTKFFAYALSIETKRYVRLDINPKLMNTEMAQIRILVPPKNEQKLIEKYLDKKSIEINSLISDKERLIELLEEKRQAVITETVTKGLDPNVKMKDSGIEWIGEIPEHWESTKIKYLSSDNLIYGANESAEFDDRNLPRYIRITDIDKKGDLRKDTFKSLPNSIASKYPVIKGDLLFARSGATVGKTYLHESEDLACYAGYLIKFRSNPNKLNSKFLYFYTNSYSYKKWIKASTIQATIENVSAEKYGNMHVPYPPIQKQDEIVCFLESYIENDRILLESIKLQIFKLKEYRESLIYEAVTGKIDVRDYITETEEVH